MIFELLAAFVAGVLLGAGVVVGELLLVTRDISRAVSKPW